MFKTFNKITTMLGLAVLVFSTVVSFSGVKAEAYEPAPKYSNYTYTKRYIKCSAYPCTEPCPTGPNAPQNIDVFNWGANIPNKALTGMFVDLKSLGGQNNSWVILDAEICDSYDKCRVVNIGTAKVGLSNRSEIRTGFDLERFGNDVKKVRPWIRADFNNPSGTIWRYSTVGGDIWYEQRIK
jgi:hypothetical protein